MLLLSLLDRQKLRKRRLRAKKWRGGDVKPVLLDSSAVRVHRPDSTACLGCQDYGADSCSGSSALREVGGEPGSDVEGKREGGEPHDCRKWRSPVRLSAAALRVQLKGRGHVGVRAGGGKDRAAAGGGGKLVLWPSHVLLFPFRNTTHQCRSWPPPLASALPGLLALFQAAAPTEGNSRLQVYI